MAKKKKEVPPGPFIKEESMITVSGHVVEKGDLIKVRGQYGTTFKFQYLTTNPKNQKTWVDCFEMQKGLTGPSRSFNVEDVKPVVKRGKRVKRTINS